jgi:hypothetical protein
MVCLTGQLAPNSRFFIEKLIIAHQIKIFPAIYGVTRFITVSTRVRHWNPKPAEFSPLPYILFV